MNRYHVSVLLQEAVTALQVAKDRKYIDATLGAGGHTQAILNLGGSILGIDQDDDALAHVGEKLKSEIAKGKLQTVKGNFAHIGDLARENGFAKVSGILFDIGVSSHQLETNDRGFSFLSDSSLDMRMDTSLAVTAADLLKILTKKELYELFKDYGEENNAWAIAEAVDRARHIDEITTTKQLADIVARVGRKKGKIHPATKVFQALRIAVNDELGSLEKGLEDGIELLEKNGRLVVISFHSLEDRIVKKKFEKFALDGRGKIITEKPIVPTEEEVQGNSRSRSAKMRIFEHI